MGQDEMIFLVLLEINHHRVIHTELETVSCTSVGTFWANKYTDQQANGHSKALQLSYMVDEPDACKAVEVIKSY